MSREIDHPLAPKIQKSLEIFMGGNQKNRGTPKSSKKTIPFSKKYMDVSENNGCFPQNHPFLIGFSIINHPFWGTQNEFLETPESSATHFLQNLSFGSIKGGIYLFTNRYPSRNCQEQDRGF